MNQKKNKKQKRNLNPAVQDGSWFGKCACQRCSEKNETGRTPATGERAEAGGLEGVQNEAGQDTEAARCEAEPKGEAPCQKAWF